MRYFTEFWSSDNTGPLKRVISNGFSTFPYNGKIYSGDHLMTVELTMNAGRTLPKPVTLLK